MRQIKSIAGKVGEMEVFYTCASLVIMGTTGVCDKIRESGSWFEVWKNGKLTTKVRESCIDKITYKENK